MSALSEELGFGPLRISGRIDASGTRTALKKAKAPHNLLLDHGKGQNVDSSIQKVAESLNDKDLVVVGANAIDPMGRAALAFAALGGGSRGYALHSAYMQGVPMLILAGINKRSWIWGQPRLTAAEQVLICPWGLPSDYTICSALSSRS